MSFDYSDPFDQFHTTIDTATHMNTKFDATDLMELESIDVPAEPSIAESSPDAVAAIAEQAAELIAEVDEELAEEAAMAEPPLTIPTGVQNSFSLSPGIRPSTWSFDALYEDQSPTGPVDRPARKFHPGMGQAVAERTILRKKSDASWESWEDVAGRVSIGNAWLCPDEADRVPEFGKLYGHTKNATILLSGRHLQHGDIEQPTKNLELFSNCSTSSSSFLLFYLLLNGSGVGRCYDDDMMLVNWNHSPTIRCVLSQDHADFDYSAHESVRDAKHKYGTGRGIIWHAVGDSREGWAKALEIAETMAFEKIHKDKILILDFSGVRPKGGQIAGMQGRPSCGPVPTMNAFAKLMTIRGGGLPKWKQALYVDHYFAESVLVGGARRAARMATKTWRDPSVFGFINSKRPIEFEGQDFAGIAAIRETSAPQSFLWSANMSIMVDAEFWEEVRSKPEGYACKVFDAATGAAYGDGTGEPGFINVDKLDRKTADLAIPDGGLKIGSAKYAVERATRFYLDTLLQTAREKSSPMIVNPCGEVALALWGGVCIIGDVVPFHATTLDEAEDAFRVTTRALIRVNTMDAIYGDEVRRTNRIGVGMTGLHEFAWKFFGYGFRDLIDEAKSRDFWMTLARFKRAVQEEAREYSAKLGMVTPHTDTTEKPAGSVSKLFGLTEGVHLPAMPFYLRWVQFRTDDPLVETYRAAGYPVRELTSYQSTSIVGFPTTLVISTLGMGDKLVTAGDATPAEQYQWLMLLEKYYIRGVDKDGNPLEEDTGNQVSYTLKYSPAMVSYEEFAGAILENQPKVKCCSVMPQEDTSSYEYLPEESVTKADFEAMAARIRRVVEEDVDQIHVDCAGGACPIDFTK